MCIRILPHVFSYDSPEFLNNWLDDLHLDIGRCDRWEAYEENRDGWRLSIVFVIVADDVGPPCGIREKDAKAWRISQAIVDFLSPLECSSGLSCLFVLNEGKLWKDFDFFNDAIIRHDMRHLSLVVVLRNATEPKFPHKDSARLHSYNFF